MYTASDQKLDGGKAWKRTASDQNLTVGRPGNKAILSNGYMIEIFW